ncbi:hypothetical protein NG701_07615 [Pseudarthrobacter sp. HLT3-5]|uniref:hypothetical protein n=1 Tax=Pseudarthrobacter cellobiosi TaxID=2953654 RepID=UPI00208F391D|nr:hypothetical protein [Pseudarthrobacter sp. HLT3-5]MCO4274296.1 hypothetical protein [Pseudarthrobacter sp. HLT3-5]
MTGERYPDLVSALSKEVKATESDYFNLDEIQLVRRYDKLHELESRPLDDEQRQLVDFIIRALLSRIEYKISPSFRHQLEEEAQQTNFQEDPTWAK